MSDGFLPAHATSAKAKKHARQQASKPTTSSSTAKAKGKGKASAASPAPHLLSTQPSQGVDDMMEDFERVPLDEGVERRKAVGGQAVAAGEADAAMAVEEGAAGTGGDDEDDAVMIDPSQLPTPVVRTPIASLEANAAASSSSDPNSLSFAPVTHHNASGLTQRRKISIPPHRMTPLKRDWIKIYTPLVEECGLQVRMNVQKRQIEMKTSKHTPHPSALTRAADFLSAYCLGFAVEDAIAMLRMEELYIESFEIKDIKMLHGDHLSRAIGRLAGHEGKARFAIENATRTRIVLADTRIHILGTFSNIAVARSSISALVLGSPPGKVFANLSRYASLQRSRY
ncbi:pre-rRNA-processing protein pno1 [Rhodotorula toruloides]